jgi:predicted Zn-dependent protease
MRTINKEDGLTPRVPYINAAADGGRTDSNSLSIVLVFFDVREKSIPAAIRRSMEGFFSSLQKELSMPLNLSIMYRDNPPIAQIEHRKDEFRRIMHGIDGSIKIGITEVGLWDPVPPSRYLYAIDCDSHASLLSLHRFRQESTGTEQLLQRLEKGIVKAFGMACGLYHCNDQGCFLTYHLGELDLDTNMYVCKRCRADFVHALQSLGTASGETAHREPRRFGEVIPIPARS